MMPIDLFRVQLAIAFGLLDVQQRMVSGAWQMALWWMPGGAAVTAAGAGNVCTPSGKGRVKV